MLKDLLKVIINMKILFFIFVLQVLLVSLCFTSCKDNKDEIKKIEDLKAKDNKDNKGSNNGEGNLVGGVGVGNGNNDYILKWSDINSLSLDISKAKSIKIEANTSSNVSAFVKVTSESGEQTEILYSFKVASGDIVKSKKLVISDYPGANANEKQEFFPAEIEDINFNFSAIWFAKSMDSVDKNRILFLLDKFSGKIYNLSVLGNFRDYSSTQPFPYLTPKKYFQSDKYANLYSIVSTNIFNAENIIHDSPIRICSNNNLNPLNWCYQGVNNHSITLPFNDKNLIATHLGDPYVDVMNLLVNKNGLIFFEDNIKLPNGSVVPFNYDLKNTWVSSVDDEVYLIDNYGNYNITKLNENQDNVIVKTLNVKNNGSNCDCSGDCNFIRNYSKINDHAFKSYYDLFLGNYENVTYIKSPILKVIRYLNNQKNNLEVAYFTLKEMNRINKIAVTAKNIFVAGRNKDNQDSITIYKFDDNNNSMILSKVGELPGYRTDREVDWIKSADDNRNVILFKGKRNIDDKKIYMLVDSEGKIIRENFSPLSQSIVLLPNN
ncbi:MAG: hypothetical protein HQK51_20160 [Oligoflexia bacterium]|nr:hypothetical protein [Oligoflexia bacterium]